MKYNDAIKLILKKGTFYSLTGCIHNLQNNMKYDYLK